LVRKNVNKSKILFKALLICRTISVYPNRKNGSEDYLTVLFAINKSEYLPIRVKFEVALIDLCKKKKSVHLYDKVFEKAGFGSGWSILTRRILLNPIYCLLVDDTLTLSFEVCF
jgi:hypothetical protein